MRKFLLKILYENPFKGAKLALSLMIILGITIAISDGGGRNWVRNIKL